MGRLLEESNVTEFQKQLEAVQPSRRDGYLESVYTTTKQGLEAGKSYDFRGLAALGKLMITAGSPERFSNHSAKLRRAAWDTWEDQRFDPDEKQHNREIADGLVGTEMGLYDRANNISLRVTRAIDITPLVQGHNSYLGPVAICYGEDSAGVLAQMRYCLPDGRPGFYFHYRLNDIAEDPAAQRHFASRIDENKAPDFSGFVIDNAPASTGQTVGEPLGQEDWRLL